MCKSLASAALSFALLALIGCSGLQSTFAPASPNSPVPQSKPQSYAIYVSQDANRRFSNASPMIAAYYVNGEGGLGAVLGSPLPVPGATAQLLAAAGGRFLFANSSDLVSPQTGIFGPNSGFYKSRLTVL